MKTKEGGVMDIQKKEKFEALPEIEIMLRENPDIKFENGGYVYRGLNQLTALAVCYVAGAWMAWQADKAKAVPEWINVHLLSPQIDTEVLICVDDDVQLAVWRVDDCGGYFEDAIGEIKWWMPLPKAQEQAND